MKSANLLKVANATFTPTSAIRKATASNFIVTEHNGDWYALALLRAADKNPEPNHWGLPGGGVEEEETLLEGAIRETAEEAGYRTDQPVIAPIALVPAPDKGKQYLYTMTYVQRPFVPDLAGDPSHEHQDYKWVRLSQWPEPAHARVKALIESVGVAELETIAKQLKSRAESQNLNPGFFTSEESDLDFDVALER